MKELASLQQEHRRLKATEPRNYAVWILSSKKVRLCWIISNKEVVTDRPSLSISDLFESLGLMIRETNCGFDGQQILKA